MHKIISLSFNFMFILFIFFVAFEVATLYYFGRYEHLQYIQINSYFYYTNDINYYIRTVPLQFCFGHSPILL